MRLGGPILSPTFGADPAGWAAAHRARGWGAAYCPLRHDASDAAVETLARVCRDHDLIIAEVGAWSNPISPDPAVRAAARQTCIDGLALAERIGALCCVNIAGACGTQWDGPHPDNLLPATFDAIVESVQEILDAVRPTRTFYTLETMPWVFPDSAESYLALLRAIDRPAFAVHLDPVNLVNCPARAYDTAGLLRACFDLLGPWIKGCHAKDIQLSSRLTVHLDEALPGEGCLDWGVYLTELDRLAPDTPLMVEHLTSQEDYDRAAAHIQSVAARLGIALR